MSMMVNPFIYGGSAPPVSFILDTIPGAVRAYGLRKLRSAYAGAAIRVVRSSDSTEMDIGFTSGGELDTATLLSFAGSGSAVVKTWYDQSGSAKDATDVGTAARRPRIVNAGVIDKIGSAPALFFTGGNGLQFDNTGAMRLDWTADVVFNTAQSNAGGTASSWYTMNGFLFSEASGVVNDFSFGNYGNKLCLGEGLSGGTDNSLSTAKDIRLKPHTGVCTRVSSTGAVALYLDGLTGTAGTLATGDRTASPTAWIGFGNSPAAYFGEVIIWPSVLNSTQLGTLSTSQNTRFGIDPNSELTPIGLAFTQTNNIDYTDMLPAALVDMTENFTADTGQFTKYTESAPGTTSVSGGKMTITHTGAQNDLVTRADITLSIPQVWVEAQFNSVTMGTSYDGVTVGIVKDGNNFVSCGVDRLNSIIRTQVKIGGTNSFVTSTSMTIPASFKLGMSLVGTSVCIFIDTGSGWVNKASINIVSNYDFRTIGNLTGWKPGFTAANGAGNSVWEVSNFKAGRFGAVGLRDITLVTNEDGTPYYQASDVVLFTATCADARGTDPLGSYFGVFELNLTSKAIAQKSAIMVQRDGKIYNDHAGHIIRYPGGNRRLLLGTWGNGFNSTLQTLHALLTSGDILAGTNLVTTAAQITLPGQTGVKPGAYDAMAAYDAANSRWLIAYALVTNTSFSGSPFYAALCSTTDWSSFTLIGADSANTGWEGTKLLWNNNQFWVMAGGPAGSGNSSRIYDAATMTYRGALGAAFSGGVDTQPHPMVFPYGSKQILLSFDNTKYGTGSFTWGNVRLYEAARY